MVELTADRARVEAIDLDALHEHGPLLLATARAITLDDAEAQDLVQTTFETALRSLDQLRDPTALRAWLLRIQTREAFRVVRRLRRLIHLDRDRHDLADTTADPAFRAEHVDLWAALGDLPTRIRATVVLHHMVGLPVRDTASALGVSENTVKAQLKTGLARLREALDDD